MMKVGASYLSPRLKRRQQIRVRNNSAAGASLDRLVGSGELRRRDVDSERLSGLQIDHMFKFGRVLNRKLACVGALEMRST
jgi:hypothetical protein